jgi:hypothetical protein
MFFTKLSQIINHSNSACLHLSSTASVNSTWPRNALLQALSPAIELGWNQMIEIYFELSWFSRLKYSLRMLSWMWRQYWVQKCKLFSFINKWDKMLFMFSYTYSLVSSECVYKAYWKSLRCRGRLEELRDRDELGATPCHCTDTTQQLTNRLS